MCWYIDNAYIFSKLIKRLDLKRNANIFHLIHELWKLLNPFNYRSLAKSIFLGFNTFVYSEIISGYYTDPSVASKNAMHDLRVDLGKRKGINFK